MNTRVYSFLLLLLSATKLKQATAGYSKRTVLLLDAIYTNLETTINYPTFCFHLNIKKKRKDRGHLYQMFSSTELAKL